MKNILVTLAVLSASACLAQTSPVAPPTLTTAAPASSTTIPPGAKLFIQPMDGFESYLTAAIMKKKVPVTVVDSASSAAFIVSGSSKLDKASWAKTIFVSPNAHAQASISIKNAQTGAIVFAYNVDKANSARGDQSTAEACAKHLKQDIEKK